MESLQPFFHPDSSPPNRRLNRTQSYRDARRRLEKSIYPSKEDLGRYLPADIDISDIFDRSRSPLPLSPGVRHRGQSLTSGAKEFDQLSFPHVHDGFSQPLSQDPAARNAYDYCSDSYYEPREERDYSKFEYGCSHSEEPHDPPPMSEHISDCSSNISTQSLRRSPVERERTPVQVLEVYPGEFLQLRGAKETVEAIERGHSQSVFCYACGLGLRCVTDCELVICPDCHIMSPVPRRRPVSLFEDIECEDEIASCRYRGSLPQLTPLWNDDEDESSHSSRQKGNIRSRNGSSVGSTGGVGLGLRIDN